MKLIYLLSIFLLIGCSLATEPKVTPEQINWTSNATFSNLISSSGWVPCGETWSYSSADSPSFVANVSTDLTAKYYAGMKVKLTQTTAKYFIITKVAYSSPNTMITMYGGTDYTLANAAITSPYFSITSYPIGFPQDPNKWTVTVTHSTEVSQATPTDTNWYNIGAINISMPIGLWNVEYISREVEIYDDNGYTGDAMMTLSTSSSAESNTGYTSMLHAGGPGLTAYDCITTLQQRIMGLSIAAKTTYYLIEYAHPAGLNFIKLKNNIKPTTIRAVCAYFR
jgi:hypothetical protein